MNTPYELNSEYKDIDQLTFSINGKHEAFQVSWHNV